MMTEQAAAARRAYKRAWAAKNPDKVKAQQERHWEKVAQQAQQNKQQPVHPPQPLEVTAD